MRGLGFGWVLETSRLWMKLNYSFGENIYYRYYFYDNLIEKE